MCEIFRKCLHCILALFTCIFFLRAPLLTQIKNRMKKIRKRVEEELAANKQALQQDLHDKIAREKDKITSSVKAKLAEQKQSLQTLHDEKIAAVGAHVNANCVFRSL